MPTASDGRTRPLEALEALGAHDFQIGSLETLASRQSRGLLEDPSAPRYLSQGLPAGCEIVGD